MKYYIIIVISCKNLLDFLIKLAELKGYPCLRAKKLLIQYCLLYGWVSEWVEFNVPLDTK